MVPAMHRGSAGPREDAEATAPAQQEKSDLGNVTWGEDEALKCPGMEQGCWSCIRRNTNQGGKQQMQRVWHRQRQRGGRFSPSPSLAQGWLGDW